MKQYVIAYIPVIHRGYLRFLDKHAAAEQILVLGSELIAEFDQLRKDIRSLQPEQVQSALAALGLHSQIEIATPELVSRLATQLPAPTIMMPDEDIMHQLAEKYFPKLKVVYDSVFLRWDSNNALKHQEVEADEVLEDGVFHQRMIQQAKDLAQRSGDWWRQVGALIVKDEQVVSQTFNKHVPTQQQPLYDGDPRGNFHKGLNIEISTALHAEAGLIAQAAREGQALTGAELYVTTFPCPPCAKLVAYSGIKTVYFSEGYAMVDGERILKDRGVRIVRVV